MSAQVPAVARALAILRLLSAHPAGLSAARIAALLDAPRSSAYHLLTALQDDGFVLHVPEERRYVLGVTAVDLGSAITHQATLSFVGNPLMAALVRRVRLPVHLGLLHGREVLYVIEQRPPRSTALVTEPEVRLPAHITASGRAMLAHLPPSHLAALFNSGAAFVTRTGEGPRSLPALRRVLAQERRQGYACERGEVTRGLHSVAVPAFDRHGRPAASVAVTYRARDGVPDGLLAHATRTARELSRRLGA